MNDATVGLGGMMIIMFGVAAASGAIVGALTVVLLGWFF